MNRAVTDAVGGAVAALITVIVAFSGIAFAKGDAIAGRSKAGECAACHGSTGVSASAEWPNLAGQKYGYLVEQLKTFQGGSRSNPVMTPIARQLSRTDVRDLAAYFSEQKPAAAVVAAGVTKRRIDAGRALTFQCTACHGLRGMSPTKARAAAWPDLAGQRYDYLVAQLQAFQEGARRNSLMSPMARRLSPAEVRDVAAYFSVQQPVLAQASNFVGAAAGHPILHPPIIRSALVVPRPHPAPSYWEKMLPAGSSPALERGRGIVLEKCTLCHTLHRVVAFVRPKKQWHGVAEAMRRRGSPVTQKEVGLVVNYLATYFGPGSPPNAEAKELGAGHIVAQKPCTRSEWPKGSSDFRRNWKAPYNIWVSNMMGGSIDVVDPITMKVVDRIVCISSPDRAQFSRHGNWAYVPDRVEHNVTVINTRTGAIVKKIPLIDAPNTSVLGRDFRRLYVGIWPLNGDEAKRGYVQVIDTRKLKVIKTIKAKGGIHDVWMSPLGRELLAMSPPAHFMDLFSTKDYHLIWKCCRREEIGTMNMEPGPDGSLWRIFFSYAGYPGIVVVSGKTGKELERIAYPIPTSGPYKGMAPASGNGKDFGFHGGQITSNGKYYWVMQGSWLREFELPSFKFIGEVRLALVDQAGLAYRPLIEGSWLAISPRDDTVWASRPGRNLLSKVDAGTRKEVAEIPVGQYPLHIAIWPRGAP